ncbi:uncharacterized protein ACR2FA_007349 [Aphomia sociella]
MLAYALLALSILSAASSNEYRRHRIKDPFAELDRYISHALAYHYLWPWSQEFKAAAADSNDHLMEHLQRPKIISDDKKFEIKLSVRKFKPEELNVTVQGREIVVMGVHGKSKEDYGLIMTSMILKRFELPPECKPEEVKAILNEDGVLSVWAPKYKLPPPLLRLVPIEVKLPVKKVNPVKDMTAEDIIKMAEAEESEYNKTEKQVEIEEKIESVKPEITTEAPLLHEEDATTHVGKIRKKELKSTTKTVKENEVTKGGEGNGLDYMLIDGEAEE